MILDNFEKATGTFFKAFLLTPPLPPYKGRYLNCVYLGRVRLRKIDKKRVNFSPLRPRPYEKTVGIGLRERHLRPFLTRICSWRESDLSLFKIPTLESPQPFPRRKEGSKQESARHGVLQVPSPQWRGDAQGGRTKFD